jgi:zinc transporter ZupT
MWSSGLSAGWVVADFFNQYGILLGIVLALLAGFLVWLAWSRRQT